MPPQVIRQNTREIPTELLNLSTDEVWGVISESYLNFAKESYTYLLALNSRTHGSCVGIPNDPDSSIAFSISGEEFVTLHEALIKTTYIEDTDEWPVASIPDATEKCIEFCNTHNLIPDIENSLQEIRKIFSNIKDVVADYDCFPADEYEEDGHIVLKVYVDSDQDTAFKEYDDFVAWMLDNMTDENSDLFILTVIRSK